MSRNVRVLAAVGLALGALTVAAASEWRRPGSQRGYRPEQPLAFSHRLHAGELEIDCRYCHQGGERSRHAGLPPVSLCMNCHGVVTAGFDAMLEEKERAAAEGREPDRVVSPELRKLYDAAGLDQDLRPASGATARALEWVRVHDLPDFVWFDHRPHLRRGVACETCHGPVRGMERVEQWSDLSMGWCVDCHRANSADPAAGVAPPGSPRVPAHVSTDCATCHF